jgi:hypothetical protein
MLVPFASIRAVQDDPRQAYVTVVFPVAVIENDDCRTIDCSFGARSPRRLTTPTTSPTRPRLIAAPPR